MKKLLTLCMFAVLFAGIFAGTNEKIKSIKKSETGGENAGITNVILKPTDMTATPINSVGNIRSVLGGGRHIILDESGNVHATGLQGNGATYSLFYSVSDDNGATWNNFNGIGLNGAGGRDRYPAIDLSGVNVNIAFHNQIDGAGYVAFCPDPLNGGAFTLTSSLTPSSPSNWLPTIYADRTTDNVIAAWTETNGTWPTLKWNLAKSTNGGTNWFVLGEHPDTIYNVNSTYGASGPQLMIEGDYVIMQFWSDDISLLGLDTAITNNVRADMQCWALYSESTDGGETWTAGQLLMGTQVSDFPTQRVVQDNTVRYVPACGGGYWPSVSQGWIHDGMVYMVTPSALIDFEGEGFFDASECAILSIKPVGIGGTWTHRVISGDAVAYGTSQVFGYARYPEISMMHSNPRYLACSYFDAANGNMAFTASWDYGYTWRTDSSQTKLVSLLTDLGFAADGGIYMHSSPYMTSVPELDVTFLQSADGTVITNGNQYHVRVDLSDIIGVGENPVTVNDFNLSQNFPNPFNPSTTISYDVKGTNNVTLKIYNTLGQEVKTLVNTRQNAGNYKVQWDGKDNAGKSVASGVYIYRLEAGDVKLAKKMMFMK